MKLSIPRVKLSQDAFTTVRNCVNEANNQFEVGGVLLGYKFLNRFYVSSATAQLGIEDKSNVSFTLDGEWNMSRIAEINQSRTRKLSVLGVWHSHICDEDKFSYQDRQSNLELARLYGSIISAITIQPSPHRVSLTAYLVSPKGKESLCKVKIC